MISFAQNLEDVLISRFFRGDAPQTYVDVGAAHHSYHSVTKHFYDIGWRGLNIEPRTHLWELLNTHRTEDCNVQCGVSDEAGTMKFYEVISPTFTGTDAGGLSTFDAGKIEAYRKQEYLINEKELSVVPLSDLLHDNGIQEVGFLKIDVEGFEFQVIKGLDLSRWRPRLIIAECTTPMTDIQCDDQLHQHLNGQGYSAAAFDGLNRFYVRQEDAQRAALLSVPANIADGYMRAEELELRHAIHACQAQNSELAAKHEVAQATELAHRSSIEHLEERVCRLQLENTRLKKFGKWINLGGVFGGLKQRKIQADSCETRPEAAKTKTAA